MSSPADWRIIAGDARDELDRLPASSVHTIVTSPPYYGLRDYGTGDRQIGLEPSPDEYVAELVAVMRAARRALRDDGTLWLNLGDSYFGSGRGPSNGTGADTGFHTTTTTAGAFPTRGVYTGAPGVKPKDLIGIPWLVAFALRADGWYLRSEIIWHKPNPMPESVTDRPTKSHEQVFLLSKMPRYFYDADAVREDHTHVQRRLTPMRVGKKDADNPDRKDGDRYVQYDEPSANGHPNGRNKRSVWTVATQPYAGAHFATFPPKLIEPCILAGCPERCCGVCGAPWERVVKNHGPDKVNEHDRHIPGGQNVQNGLRKVAMGAQWHRETLGFEPSCGCNAEPTPGTVLDPFAGAGTTGLVAGRHRRRFVGIELNPHYAQLARDRIATAQRLGYRNPTTPPDTAAGQTSLQV